MKKTKGIIFVLCFLLVFGSIVQPVSAKKFNAKEAKKKVTVTYKKTSNGILAIYKNKNKVPVKITATMHFLGSNNKDTSKETRTNNCVSAKSTATIFFRGPIDADGNYISYVGYKGSYKVQKSKYKGYAKKITVSSELRVIDGAFTAVNLSGKDLSNIEATIAYYDGNDNLMGCRIQYLNCFKKNSIDQFTVDYIEGKGIPVKVKVYINTAY